MTVTTNRPRCVPATQPVEPTPAPVPVRYDPALAERARLLLVLPQPERSATRRLAYPPCHLPIRLSRRPGRGSPTPAVIPCLHIYDDCPRTTSDSGRVSALARHLARRPAESVRLTAGIARMPECWQWLAANRPAVREGAQLTVVAGSHPEVLAEAVRAALAARRHRASPWDWASAQPPATWPAPID